MTRLVLVRHAVTGETGRSLSGRLPGINLSATGLEQAEAVATRLAGVAITALYASPIERTTETAARIAARHPDLAVHPLDGVIEADYGEWSGRPLAELAREDLWKVVQRTPSRMRFPGGESIPEVQHRVVATLEDLVARHPDGVVVVVAHSDPIQLAVAHYTGVHVDLYQRIAISPASVTVIDVGPHGTTLVTSNDTGTLDALLAPRPEPTDDDARHPGDQVSGGGAGGEGGSPKGADEPAGSSEPASATQEPEPASATQNHV